MKQYLQNFHFLGISFAGKLKRRQFIAHFFLGLVPILLAGLLVWLSSGINPSVRRLTENSSSFNLGVVLLIIVVVWTQLYMLGIYARRLHDFHLTGWLSILSQLPYVNLLFIVVMMVVPSAKPPTDSISVEPTAATQSSIPVTNNIIVRSKGTA